MNYDHFIVPPGQRIPLKDYDPGFAAHYKNGDEASAKLRKHTKRPAKYQVARYAQNSYALARLLQGKELLENEPSRRNR